MLCRFPDVVVGVLTRESVRAALRGGISAQQVIRYLEQHSHPQVLRHATCVTPPAPEPRHLHLYHITCTIHHLYLHQITYIYVTTTPTSRTT